MRRVTEHILVIGLAIFFLLFVPGMSFTDARALLSGSVDAVSGASVEVPDQPSGTFVILIRNDRHPLSMEDWTNFFQEKEVGVIMEDLSCLVDRGDPLGQEAANRYQLRLAENQMTVRQENGTLLVSKAEAGLFDVIILSREMADYYDYSRAAARPDVTEILVESTVPSETAAGRIRKGGRV